MNSRPARRAGTATATVLLTLGLTACVGPTPEQQTVTLQYEGGKFIRTPLKFSRCVPGGTRGDYDLGGRSATYPGDQRVVRFTGEDGADRGPITVKSKDGIEMAVVGTMQYNLNTECNDEDGGALSEFHLNIGRRYDASFDEGLSEIPPGWRIIQREYVETPMEKTLIREASNAGWFSLWKDAEAQRTLEKAVNDNITEAVNTAAPTDLEFYKNFRFSITRIEPFGERGEQVKQAIADGETRAAEARANEQAALANERAAVAETRAEVERAKKRQAEIAGYGGDLNAYNDGKMIEKGLNPRQPVYGGAVAVPPG